MFATKLTFGCLVLALVCPTNAFAQEDCDPSRRQVEDFYRPVPPFPPDWRFTYHHASTVAEGWLRGRAALLHSEGNYWLSLSQALICREQARWLALDNRRRWIEYRRWVREWHELDRQRRVDARRIENQASHVSRYSAYLLSPYELDRTTGRITWPELLQTVEYAGLREQLDSLFQDRVRFSAAEATEIEIDRYVERLVRALRRHVAKTDRNEYLTAQKFLRGLKYESEVGPQIN